MINPTEYVPKSYHPRVSTYWWLARWAYLKFIVREVSSVAVAWTVVLTLLQIAAVTGGFGEYAEFERWLRNPLVITINVIAFLLLLFHALTWFSLAPKAMVVRLGGRRLPDVAITAPNYLGWGAVSALVAWIILGS